MNDTGQRNEEDRKRRVLATLALFVAMILSVPAVMYSITPAGPIRDGDVIYANDRHEARFRSPEAYQDIGYGVACFLERRDALVVVQKSSDRRDGLLLCRVTGRIRIEIPFCPPNAEVLLRPHQVVQKLTLWDDLIALLR